MTPVGKAVGGGAVILGGGSAIGYGVKYVLDKAPDHTLLADISNLTSTYSTDKYGNTGNNKDSFVDPSKNEEWWKWSYTKRFSVEGAESTEFKAVTMAYSTSVNTALNKVCETAFKKEKKKLVKITYKKDIWRYCSSSGVVVKGVEDAPEATVLGSNGDSTKLSGVGSNKDKLVKDSENEEWWNWVYENKFLEDKTKIPNDFSSEFNVVNKGYDSGTDNNALNKVCKTAHSKTKTDFSDSDTNKKKYKKNIEFYCTKDLTEGSLTSPT